MFILISDTNGNPVHLNLQQIAALKLLVQGEAQILMASDEKIHLSASEAEKVTPFLEARTYTPAPFIMK